jgi:hypothetical protein
VAGSKKRVFRAKTHDALGKGLSHGRWDSVVCRYLCGIVCEKDPSSKSA